MNDNAHDELKALVAPYVLGALSPDEVRTVRAHILTCDDCMSEADSFSSTASMLAMAVDDAPVPRGFVENVITEAIASSGTAPSATVEPRRRWSLIPALMGAASVLMIVVLSVALVQTRSDLGRHQKVVSALVRDDGVQLNGDGAVAKMVPAGDGGLFVAAGLAEAPQEHTYQLWLVKDGVATSAGTFEVEDGEAILETDTSFEGFGAVAVTVEPDGGSSTPTSKPIMTSPIT